MVSLDGSFIVLIILYLFTISLFSIPSTFKFHFSLEALVFWCSIREVIWLLFLGSMNPALVVLKRDDFGY